MSSEVKAKVFIQSMLGKVESLNQASMHEFKIAYEWDKNKNAINRFLVFERKMTEKYSFEDFKDIVLSRLNFAQKAFFNFNRNVLSIQKIFEEKEPDPLKRIYTGLRNQPSVKWCRIKMVADKKSKLEALTVDFISLDSPFTENEITGVLPVFFGKI